MFTARTADWNGRRALKNASQSYQEARLLSLGYLLNGLQHQVLQSQVLHQMAPSNVPLRSICAPRLPPTSFLSLSFSIGSSLSHKAEYTEYALTHSLSCPLIYVYLLTHLARPHYQGDFTHSMLLHDTKGTTLVDPISAWETQICRRNFLSS